MGIRVYKILGYGVTDLEPNDSRIDWITFRQKMEEGAEIGRDEFIEWVGRHKEEISKIFKKDCGYGDIEDDFKFWELLWKR